MVKDNKFVRFFYGFFFALALQFSANAKDNLFFIIDGSNSMWGQIDGVSKIEIAKKEFRILLSDVPDHVNIGVAAYGHTKTSSCDDIELLSGFRPKGERNKLAEAVDNITPRGKTPIAGALRKYGKMVTAEKKGGNNNIVLISDGVETCGGDPCAVAKELIALGLDLRMHVVGFDLSAKEREQLVCIADNGNGEYFSANSTSGFKNAIEQAVKAATIPKPEIKLQEAFLDNFDGDELADHWQVLNADTNAFMVKGGNLQIRNSKKGTFTDVDFKNLFLLNYDLPKGDWTITARLQMPPETTREHIHIGLFDDNTNWISASISPYFLQDLNVSVKIQSGEVFEDSYMHMFAGEGTQAVKFSEDKSPFDLQLIKEGNLYRARAVSTVDRTLIFETKSLISGHGKGRFAIGLTQNQNPSGTTTATIDWIKVETRD